MLRSGKGVHGPVKSVVAVVFRAAALGWIVDCTEVLPFRRAHFWAGCELAGRSIILKSDNDVVEFYDKDATELVEPERAVDASRRVHHDSSGMARDGFAVLSLLAVGVLVPQGFEVDLKCERRVNLRIGQLGRLPDVRMRSKLTSSTGTRAGPRAKSAAVVPGRILSNET